MKNRMWGGRFQAGPDAIVEAINASIDFDRELFRQDIAGSKAHAKMLGKQGIIAAEDAKKIVRGLDTILSEIEGGKFKFSRALEDIHTHVEARLKDLIGPAAGRLHTARSRNDQVATDLRLYVRDAIDGLDAALAELQRRARREGARACRRPSCRALRICSRRSRSRSGITCSPMWRCSRATAAGWRTRASA